MGDLWGFGRHGALAGGSCFCLLANVCLLALQASRRIKLKLMDWTLLGYFILAAIATFVVRSTTFPKYSSVIIWALYAGVSWGSILFGAPFTVQYARESAPPERWHSPGFIRANQIMSVVWSIAFAVNIVLVTVALNPRDYPLVSGVGAPILIMVAASIFTSRYTRIIRERAQQA
ncbi:MAG TPA: hypothetical protein VII95_19415 [Terriglobales bacterium]|jgi:uncharacterized membrane protein